MQTEIGAGVRRAINLHIDELVLPGFAAGDRYGADAVRECHGAGCQAAGGIIPPAIANNADQPHVDAGTVQLTAGTKANSIGAQIAQAVHGGITR